MSTPGIEFVFRNQNGKSFDTTSYNYVNGIVDHVAEVVGENGLSSIQHWETEVKTRDRDDKPEYKCKMDISVAFSNKVHLTEYYHNSSWLEHGGAPDKAVRNAFVYQIDSYLKQNNKYNKTESKIKYDDVEDSLVCVISSFSSVSSYENQTKKAVTNKGIQDAMTAFLRQSLEVYFIENPLEAEKICEQVLINKRSRENAEKTRLNIKKKLSGNLDITNRVAKFVDCRSKDTEQRELFIVEGDSALGACKQARNPDFQAIMPIRGKILNCLKADYNKIFKSEIITDLLKVLGCGVEVKSKANKNLSSFDMNALRWSKIISAPMPMLTASRSELFYLPCFTDLPLHSLKKARCLLPNRLFMKLHPKTMFILHTMKLKRISSLNSSARRNSQFSVQKVSVKTNPI